MAPIIPSDLVDPVVYVTGISLSAGGLTLLLAAVYRWYAATRLPTGLSLLAGFGVVAAYLNTTAVLGQAIGNTDGLLDLAAVLPNVLTFGVAGATAIVGSRAGDRLGRVAAVAAGTRTFDEEVSRVVSAAGRAIAVELPRELEDLEGYDPEPASVKEAIAGKTLLFPRRLTVAELRDRLVTRLKEDYGVGHVSIELEHDGTVSHLAVGSRAAGIGPSLPPGTVAVAIRADPPFSASTGDVVQVWTRGAEPRRIATGELRAKHDDVATLALDERAASTLDPSVGYRLVTLPREDRADNEFAGLLRVADASFDDVSIESGSDLENVPLAEVDATVVALESASGEVDVMPEPARRLAGGDRVSVLATPATLRRLQTAAQGSDSASAAETTDAAIQ